MSAIWFCLWPTPHRDLAFPRLSMIKIGVCLAIHALPLTPPRRSTRRLSALPRGKAPQFRHCLGDLTQAEALPLIIILPDRTKAHRATHKRMKPASAFTNDLAAGCHALRPPSLYLVKPATTEKNERRGTDFLHHPGPAMAHPPRASIGPTSSTGRHVLTAPNLIPRQQRRLTRQYMQEKGVVECMVTTREKNVRSTSDSSSRASVGRLPGHSQGGPPPPNASGEGRLAA
jgi:hypothetical protein